MSIPRASVPAGPAWAATDGVSGKRAVLPLRGQQVSHAQPSPRGPASGASQMLLRQLATHPHDPRDMPATAICPWSRVPLGPLGALHRLTSPSHRGTPLPPFRADSGLGLLPVDSHEHWGLGQLSAGSGSLLQRSHRATRPSRWVTGLQRKPLLSLGLTWAGTGEDWRGVGWGGVSTGGRRGVPALPASVLGPQDGSR